MTRHFFGVVSGTRRCIFAAAEVPIDSTWWRLGGRGPTSDHMASGNIPSAREQPLLARGEIPRVRGPRRLGRGLIRMGWGNSRPRRGTFIGLEEAHI